MSLNSPEVILRDYVPSSDNAYIYATWTRSDYYSAERVLGVSGSSKKQWFTEKTGVIKKILNNPATDITIACLSTNPYVIIGYIVSQKGMIQKTCIKKDYRNIGIELLLDLSVKGIDEHE